MGKIKDTSLLMRRMAWRNLQPRVPNKEADRINNSRAVRMLVLVGCLDYALMELSYRLELEGKFKHLAKKNINDCSRIVCHIHEDIYKNVLSASELARKTYNDVRDNGWASICEHVVMDSSEGAYNVCASLCRLICCYNERLNSRYCYREIDSIPHVLSLLSVLNIDDKGLDTLIDKSVNTGC